MSRTTRMLRIDPAVPVVWRDPETLQFGVAHERLRLGPVSELEERVVGLLHGGVHPDVLATLGSAEEVAEVLARLDPVLERNRPPRFRIEVFGEGAIAPALARAAAGIDAAHPLAVLAADWALPPAAGNRWLSRDERHLPIVLSDGLLEAGPLVAPGAGPCLHCAHRHRRDAWPLWPAIAAQLARRSSPVLDAVQLAEAVAAGARWIRDADAAAPGTTWRLDLVSGEERSERLPRHPDCRCAAQPGSDWVADSPREPS